MRKRKSKNKKASKQITARDILTRSLDEGRYFSLGDREVSVNSVVNVIKLLRDSLDKHVKEFEREQKIKKPSTTTIESIVFMVSNEIESLLEEIKDWEIEFEINRSIEDYEDKVKELFDEYINDLKENENENENQA